MCPLREKVNILHFIMKEKYVNVEVAKICGKNKFSICEFVRKETEISASFPIAPQNYKR